MFYQQKQPIKHTTDPAYVGSSVIGIKYNGGIIVGSDTRLNYGGLGKYHNIKDRIQRVNNNTIMGSSGEYSDYQEIQRILKEETLADDLNSQSYLGPKEISNYLSAICYYRRNKMDPYLTSCVVGGIDWDGSLVLFNIDQFGTKLQGDYFATGFGNYFLQKIIEDELKANNNSLSRRQAIDLVEKCFKVMYQKDCKAGNSIVISYLERGNEGIINYDELEKSFKGDWEFAQFRTLTNERYL